MVKQQDNASETWQRELAWVRRAVSELTAKEVAWALNIQPSALCDALAERDRKGVRAEWITKILAMASDGLRRDYLAIVAGACGYKPVKVRRISAAEELHAVYTALDRLAPGILDALKIAVEQHAGIDESEAA